MFQLTEDIGRSIIAINIPLINMYQKYVVGIAMNSVTFPRDVQTLNDLSFVIYVVIKDIVNRAVPIPYV